MIRITSKSERSQESWNTKWCKCSVAGLLFCSFLWLLIHIQVSTIANRPWWGSRAVCYWLVCVVTHLSWNWKLDTLAKVVHAYDKNCILDFHWLHLYNFALFFFFLPEYKRLYFVLGKRQNRISSSSSSNHAFSIVVSLLLGIKPILQLLQMKIPSTSV